ncbi:MAG: DNA polymerase III subunit chi [Alphaproteobacteria bacterium]
MRFDFYHLINKKISDVLPKLVEKAYDLDKKIKIQTFTEEEVEEINSLLWSYKDTSFLPHGSKKNGSEKKQPILISADYKNKNNADFLYLVNGAKYIEDTPFERVLFIFDATIEDELEKARDFYKELKQKDVELNYFQQTEVGWEKK